MEQPVSDITFHFPDRREIAAAASSGRVRPRSQVIFCLEGEEGSEPEQRVHWVPARVARSFEHDHPEPPCPYREAREALEARENKLCLAALTEMLGRRDYGTEEARRKLRHAGFRASAIDHALERAQELRFLDEERFLVSYIEERLRSGMGEAQDRGGPSPARLGPPYALGVSRSLLLGRRRSRAGLRGACAQSRSRAECLRAARSPSHGQRVPVSHSRAGSSHTPR